MNSNQVFSFDEERTNERFDIPCGKVGDDSSFAITEVMNKENNWGAVGKENTDEILKEVSSVLLCSKR